MMSTLTLVALVVLACFGASEARGWQKFPADEWENRTWAQLAWGHKSGGRDTITSKTKVVLVDVDDTDEIARLKKKEDLVVACSFSAGTLELFRSDISSKWYDAVVPGADLASWDEIWLDLSKLSKIKKVLRPRFNRAKALGCDALELDNVDCFLADDCWKSSFSTVEKARKAEIKFIKWLSKAAHSRGMGIGLKNGLEILSSVASKIDFAVNEQCQEYDECNYYEPLIEQNKMILAVEYSKRSTGAKVCAASAANGGFWTKYCTPNPKLDGLCTDKWITCPPPGLA